MTRKWVYFENIEASAKVERNGNMDLQQTPFKNSAFEKRLPNTKMISRGEFGRGVSETSYPVSSWGNITIPKMGGSDDPNNQIWRTR
jgi:uncharacterized protein YgiB involved in biofilm formation